MRGENATQRIRDISDGPLNDQEHTEFRGVNGQLQWFAKECGSEYAFECQQVAAKLSSPALKDAREANNLMKRIKQNEENCALWFHSAKNRKMLSDI